MRDRDGVCGEGKYDGQSKYDGVKVVRTVKPINGGAKLERNGERERV